MVKLRTISIDEKVEEKLLEMSKNGMSRSFFCNNAIKLQLKRLGLW